MASSPEKEHRNTPAQDSQTEAQEASAEIVSVELPAPQGWTKKDALERLANMDPLDLCGEAKVEKCRATRDLRSCGRIVQHVLTSCGHASLCAECSQRCDVCPICRVLIPKHDGKLRLRLYYECVETGLISKRQDEDFKDKGGEQQFWTEDVRHLYSLFDVAVENNLISLVCHYVSDVCMDENAVSSDAIVAMLLDGAVVKEWCKRILLSVTCSLQEIYNLGMKQMQMKSDLLHKFAMQLDGVANVLEVLEASLLESFSPQLLELQHLSEKVSKVKQHLEVMAWCIRHQFLEHVESRYMSTSHWRTTVHERKAAALERAWPDYSSNIAQLGSQPQATLFIEDALANLGIGQAHDEELGGETPDLGWLRQGGGLYLSPLKFRRDGLAVPYPMENVRAAVDILFLEGNSDLIIAKRAIFLYYLFDRHWTLRDMEWANLVDDYAGTFGITRHSMLESLVFYLLDDHTDEALQEACRLLPEIVSRTTHPKVARVLLERQSADTALMVLRCCGHDGQLGSTDCGSVWGNLVSLSEAVTAVRVRLECGLLTEAYIYQRTHCIRLRAEQSKRRLVTVGAQEGEDMDGCRNWLTEMEVLVGEICCLCIRRKLVDRMIELPWDTDEEKILHKCLLDRTVQDPSSFVGSLLVVFYIQRCRYLEACQIDRRLSNLEQQFICQTTDEKMTEMIENARQWRMRFTEKCIELLPEVQRQQLRSGNICEYSVSPFTAGDRHNCLDDMEVEQATSSSLSISGSASTGISSHGLTSLDAKKSEIIQIKSTRSDDFLLGFPSGWGGFRQPSILHGKPFRSSVESPPIIKKLDLPELNGPVNRRDQERPGLSPIRGRKLKYDIDSGKPAEASESPGQRSPASKYTLSLDVGNMEKQGAYKSKRSKGLSFHLLPLSNEKLRLGASKRTQNATENQQENDHCILGAVSPSGDGDKVSSENGFFHTQEQRVSIYLESPHSSNAGLHDRSAISARTDLDVSGPYLSTPGSSGKRSPSDRSWLASPSDDNFLRGKGGGMAPSFSFGAKDWNLLQGFSCPESFQSPSSGVEMAKPNGAVRWRSDGGEEEQQSTPTNLVRSKGYSGTHGKSVGRNRFYSSCIP